MAGAMRDLLPRTLVPALALLVAAAGRAPAQVRAIRRAELPPGLQAQFDRGALVKLSGSRTDTVSKDTPSTYSRGDLLVARTGDRPAFRRLSARPGTSGDSMFALPFMLVGLDSAGHAPEFEPMYIPEGGLQYVAASDRFVGDFLIRLALLHGNGDSIALEHAVDITLGGDADSIVPRTLTFRSAGGMYQRVHVVARNPRDSLRVQVVPQFDANGVSIWLRVQPALVIERPPASIEGYGIETATLVIGTRGLTSRDSIDVTLSADRGTLGTHALRIGPGGGTVTLRSGGGLGLATVRATSAMLATADATIRYAMPVRFILAAAVGALFGGGYAEMRRKRRSTARLAARRVITAILGAVLATAIYVGLGTMLLPITSAVPLGNEVAVFAFAAFGAIVGLKLPATTPAN